MAEGGGQPHDQGVDDYLYSEELYVDRLPENFSCPVCLCPVQRKAHLTQCCGNHFCLLCIDRVRREGKPCPMCKGRPVVIFPNKERQREINQLKVLCPLRAENGVDGGCDWTGELGHMCSHIVENHKNYSNENTEESACKVDENLQIADLRLPRHVINHSAASFSLEIPSDDTQGETNPSSNQVFVLSSSHWDTSNHPAGEGLAVLLSSSSRVTVRRVPAHVHVMPLPSTSSDQPSRQSVQNLRQRLQHRSPHVVPILNHAQLSSALPLTPSQPHSHHHPHPSPHPHPHPRPHLHPHPHCYPHPHPHPQPHPHFHGPMHPHPHPHGPRHPHPHPHGPRPHAHRPGHPHPHHHGPRCPHPHHHGPRHFHPHHCPSHP